MNKNVTIKDVAKMAGVSTSTVSRALNNYLHVKKSTREKVFKAAEKLNFKPNEIAVNLKTKKTNTIGLIIDDITNPFFSEISKVIINRAREKGYDVLIYDTDGENENLEKVLDFFSRKGVSGLLIGSININDNKHDELIKTGFPIVLFNRYTNYGVIDTVICDNELGAYKGVEYLISKGCKKIYFIAGPLNYSTFHDRFKGYVRAREEMNLNQSDSVYFHTINNDQGLGEFVKSKLKDNKNEKVAFLVSTDRIAIDVLNHVSISNFKISKEVSVVGFDNISIASSPYISLTTISQQKRKMASLSLEKLINLINNKEFKDEERKVILEPILIKRNTT